MCLCFHTPKNKSLGIGPSVGGRGDLRKGLEIFFFFLLNNPASLNQLSIHSPGILGRNFQCLLHMPGGSFRCQLGFGGT